MMEALVSVSTCVIFAILDLLDFVLCFLYKLVDKIFDKEAVTECYCYSHEDGLPSGLSKTLKDRENFARNLHRKIIKRSKKEDINGYTRSKNANKVIPHSRWSDCACQRCAWWNHEEQGKLHVALGGQGFQSATSKTDTTENVVFIHGFLSSSKFFTENLYPHLSDTSTCYRLFAVDLLGFGKSPKPSHILYTISDHVDMIETSVIQQYKMESLHLVAHSMGCVIALALAAKHPNKIKSLTLISPPYFPAPPGEDASMHALRSLSPKKIWPLLAFGCSIMSWYEHVGRTVCFVVCKHHRLWDRLVNLLRLNRKVNMVLEEITNHTHYSAWHTYHNVLCGTANEMERYLQALNESDTRLLILHGKDDAMVPAHCSLSIKSKVSKAHVMLVEKADHVTIILDMQRRVANQLQIFWEGRDISL